MRINVKSIGNFQLGGAAKSTKETATDFWSRYIQSPEYLKRLGNFRKDDPKAYQASRLDNLNSLKYSEHPESVEEIRARNWYGAYYPLNHQIVIDPKEDSVPVQIHELSHGITKGNQGLNDKELKFIKKNTKKPDSRSYDKDTQKYLLDPTEYHARLNVLRQWGEQSGYIKNFEDIDEETLMKMLNDESMPEEVYPQFEQLINTTKGRTLKDKFKTLRTVLNTLADNTEEEEVFTAQQGGQKSDIMRINQNKKKTSKYQLGGLSDIAKMLEGVDWSNYEAVLGKGNEISTKLGGLESGIGFTNSILQDDPSIFENSMIKQSARNNAVANIPEYMWKDIPFYEDVIANKIAKGTSRGVKGTGQGYDQFAGLSSLLEMFQQGGSPAGADEAIQRLGYSDDSPFKHLPQIEIMSDTVDMSATGIPIKAVPDKGKPRTLKPYSGVHTFKGASKVTEIPIMKKGGNTKYFQEGGQGAVGAQLEEGEMFITPNLDIMYTAAKMLHKDMDKDKVTDVLGSGDYVISDLDKMKITRKQADDISFGMGGVLYEEGKKPKEPIELTAAKLFKEGEDELKLSEYAERIMKTFPVSKKDDVFGRKTTAANKDSRRNFVGTVIATNEKKKSGTPLTGFASTFENKFKSVVSADGNPIKKDGTYGAFPQEGEVPEMQLGGMITAGLGLLNGVGQWFGAGKSYRESMDALRADRGQIGKLADTQSKFSALSTGAALAGYAGQNPNVEAPQYDSTQLDASIRRVPRNLFDYTAGRIAAGNASFEDQAFTNARSFSDGINAVGQNRANGLSSLAQLGMQEVQQNIGLENDYRNRKQAFSDRQILSDNTARNATRTNSNQLIAGAAGTVSGGIQSQGQIQSDRINNLRQNDFAQVQAKLDRRNTRQNAFSNITNSVSQGAIYADEKGFFDGQQPRTVEPLQRLPMVNAVNNNIAPLPTGSWGTNNMYSLAPPTVPVFGQYQGMQGVPYLQYDSLTGQYKYN